MTYYNNFIQHGDKVTCKIGGHTADNSEIIYNDFGQLFIQYDEEGDVCEHRIGYIDNPKLRQNGVTDFRIIEREDGTPVFMVGDVVENEDDSTVKVLAVFGDTFLRSYWSDHGCANNWITFREAKEMCWKLKTSTTKLKEVTLKEVCKKFGEDVTIKG